MSDRDVSEQVKTKKQMREALMRGEFGNAFRFWKDPEEVRKSGYEGLVWFCQSRKPGGRTDMSVPLEKMDEVYRDWETKNPKDMKFIQIGECPDPKWIRMNGELRLTPRGVELTYSTIQKNLREAMREVGNDAPKVVYNLQALETLKKYMNDSSYADLLDLLEKYLGESTRVEGNRKYSESPVVELHCYDRCVGVISGRNVVIGEVRDY